MKESCKNCENEYVQIRADGYCSVCSHLMKTIEGIENRTQIPKPLEEWIEKFDERAADFYVDAVRMRLRLVRDLHARQDISAHDLEMRFSQVSKLAVGKPFPKRNDMIASKLDAKQRLFVYQLLTEILIQTKPDYMRYVYKKMSFDSGGRIQIDNVRSLE